MLKAHIKYRNKYDLSTLSESSCLLPISVGQAYHEEENLEASINLLQNSFKSFSILVCDSLQRFTLQMNAPDTDIHYDIKAKKLGSDWIKRNENIFSHCEKFSTLFFWDDIITHPDFSHIKENTYNQIKSNKKLVDSMENTVHDYLRRRRISSEKSKLNMQKICKKYLIEECAALTLFKKITACDYQIYPNKHNDLIMGIYYNLMKGKPDKDIEHLFLRFNKGVQTQSQNLN